MNDSLANSYASALYDLSKGHAEILKKNLVLAGKLLEKEECYPYLNSPRIGKEGRYKIASILFQEITFPPLHALLLVLATKRKLSLFPQIKESVEALIDEEEGVERGIVWSVRPLEKEEVASLENALQEKGGKVIHLENRLDPSLRGGICVALKDRRYDGSLKEKARLLKKHLMKGDIYGKTR